MKMRTTFPVVKLLPVIFMAFSFIYTLQIISQACYSPFVENIISQTNIDTICRINRELSGDIPAVIGGSPYLIYSRKYSSPANDKAAQYILEKFISWGIPARYQVYSATGKNVIATKTGSKYPNKQFIISGHYDNTTFVYIQADTIPGADDNASGICAVLEAARILRSYTFDYTLLFIAYDEEEHGLLGSFSYADSAFFRGDSILGVINLDMIGYDTDNNNILNVGTDSNSLNLARTVFSSCRVYQPGLNPKMDWSGGGGDHYAFWGRGYKASFFVEDYNDFNIYYHTTEDKFKYLNIPYMHSIIKAAVSALAVLEKDYIINFDHISLSSTLDSGSRIASVVIKSNHKIAGGSNAPRLYYKTNISGYSFVNAYYSSGDTFKFLIPGFSPGTVVSYYVAAQDSAQTMTGTLPPGGRGISPPGTAPPNDVYTYHILKAMNICSAALPKSVPPLSVLYDSIFVSSSKQIYDVDVMLTIHHLNDEDLQISLVKERYSAIDLSSNNGIRGSNFINTIFDDEADTSIINGTPPYSGRYRPENPLSRFDGFIISGYWVLKIINSSAADTARLIEWCLDISYIDPIGITQNQVPERFELFQNFPNPFNAVTKIKYNILKQGLVNISIYDILGREVQVLVNEVLTAGKYETEWNALNMPSGVYFYRIEATDPSLRSGQGFTDTKKMILVK